MRTITDPQRKTVDAMLRAIGPLARSLHPPAIHWIGGADEGENFCPTCAERKIATLRERDPSDARMLLVALTPVALAALPGWVEKARAVTAATLAPLPRDEQARLIATLRRMG